MSVKSAKEARGGEAARHALECADESRSFKHGTRGPSVRPALAAARMEDAADKDDDGELRTSGERGSTVYMFTFPP